MERRDARFMHVGLRKDEVEFMLNLILCFAQLLDSASPSAVQSLLDPCT